MVAASIKYFFLVHSALAKSNEVTKDCQMVQSFDLLLMVQHHSREVRISGKKKQAFKNNDVVHEHCNWKCYLATHPDLSSPSVCGTNTACAEKHFLQWGQSEGRDCTCPGAAEPEAKERILRRRARRDADSSAHSTARRNGSWSGIGDAVTGTELVVAVCIEDLSWLDDAAKHYSRVTVYDKCQDVRLAPLHRFKATNVLVQRIRNIGSCDFAYLTYILDRWESLPDIVEFTKGTPSNGRYNSHGNVPLKCLSCDGTCTITRTDNVRFENPRFGAPGGSGAMEFSLSSSDVFNLPFEFSLSTEHGFANNNVSAPYHLSGYVNMGAWMDSASTVSPLSRQMYMDACCARNYGGHFATTREQIINEAYFRGRSRELYVWLRDQQHHSNAEVDHFIERTWWSVFCAANHK